MHAIPNRKPVFTFDTLNRRNDAETENNNVVGTSTQHERGGCRRAQPPSGSTMREANGSGKFKVQLQPARLLPRQQQEERSY